MIIYNSLALFIGYKKGASTLGTSSFYVIGYFYCNALGTLSFFQLSSSGISKVLIVF